MPFLDDLSPADPLRFQPGQNGLFVDYPDRVIPPDAALPLPEECKISVLTGGGMGQRLSILSRVLREADNRGLSATRLWFHHQPFPFGILIDKKVCLLAENPYLHTPNSQITVLHPLLDRDRLSAHLPSLREAYRRMDQCFESYRLLRSAYLSLDRLESQSIQPYLLSDKLDAFANRQIKKMHPVREALPKRLDVCTSTLADAGDFRSPVPILSATVRIAVSQRPPITHQILSAFTGKLTSLGISFVRNTDFGGKVYGVWIPSIKTYLGLGCPSDGIDRILNASRFVSGEIREIRPLLRGVRQQKEDISAQIAYLRKKIVGLTERTDEIYESVTNREKFLRFEKDFLIDLFQT